MKALHFHVLLISLVKHVILLYFALLLHMRFATGRGGDGTVVLVSMDGMRWQFIDSGYANTKNLNYLAQNGVKAKYIKAVVPSKTWPNHHSFLTGLYPESHGIVSNNFWDPVYQEKFVLDYDCSNYDPKFYNASEPIWLTLQKSGGRSGVYFWPGFAGYDEKPTFYEKPICYLNCNDVDPKKLPLMRNTTRSGWPPYIHCMVNHSEPAQTRIDKVIGWLKSKDPPRFVALYFENPDSTGHNYGIFEEQYKMAMEEVDRDAVGYLINSLKNANLFDSVNLIFVSDHSMTNTSSSRQIFLDKFINPDDFQLVEGGAVGHIWAAEDKIDQIYWNLTERGHPHMTVYKRENIPDSYHWKNNRRIPPIFVDPEVGWIVKKTSFGPRQGNWTVGDHGWPPTKSESYSVFFAHGPAFRKGFEMHSFNTVDLYPLMCKLLGINPLSNNGSLENVEMMLKAELITKGDASLTLKLQTKVLLAILSVTFFILNEPHA